MLFCEVTIIRMIISWEVSNIHAKLIKFLDYFHIIWNISIIINYFVNELFHKIKHKIYYYYTIDARL